MRKRHILPKILPLLLIVLIFAAPLMAMGEDTVLLARDRKAPTVSSHNLKNIISKVPLKPTIIVTFSESVKKGTTFSKITLKTSKGAAVGITTSLSGSKLTVKTKSNLAYNTSYTLTVPAKAVKDAAGNNLAKNYTLKFTTVKDTTKPAVKESYPEKDETDILENESIYLTFTKSIVEGSAIENITLTGAEEVEITAYIDEYDPYTLIIDPDEWLDYDTTYTLNVPAGAVKDKAGNGSVAYNMIFTTREEPVVVVNKIGATYGEYDEDLEGYPAMGAVILHNTDPSQGAFFVSAVMEYRNEEGAVIGMAYDLVPYIGPDSEAIATLSPFFPLEGEPALVVALAAPYKMDEPDPDVPEFTFSDLNYDGEMGEISGTLNNPSETDFEDVVVRVILYDSEGGIIGGVRQFIYDTVETGDMDFVIEDGVLENLAVASIEAEAQVFELPDFPEE